MKKANQAKPPTRANETEIGNGESERADETTRDGSFSRNDYCCEVIMLDSSSSTHSDWKGRVSNFSRSLTNYTIPLGQEFPSSLQTET